MSYESSNEPAPLSAIEEAILIVSTGAIGLTTHDGPLVRPDGADELGTPFLNVVARTASSPDNSQATTFFMINDDGIWLIGQPKGKEALAFLSDLPPHWAQWTEKQWVQAADAVKVRISSRRLDFPRDYPYYLGWNAQISNRPGTTLFLPVVDCTWQYINSILILLSAADGKRPLFIDDFRSFHPRSLPEFVAWIGAKLHLVEDIPYQPIGGFRWINNGFVTKDNDVPLGFGRGLRIDYESFFAMQNLLLVGQALGLGGWIHSSVFPPYVYQQDESKHWHGLGFRMLEPKKLRPVPPVPASQPNPVGIDGIIEGLCPPYVASMDEAVDRLLHSKYGEGGCYRDTEVFSRPYKAAVMGEEYLRNASRYSPRAIAYTKEICNYIFDTYGRFPAHVDAFYTPGIWVQFSHLDLEYYEQFFDPRLYRRQAQHGASWHADAQS